MPSAAPRVLHVALYCAPHVGGIEAVLAAETSRLVERGWEVTVLSSANGACPGERTEDGVRTVRVRSWDGMEERFGAPFPVFSPRLVLAAWREVGRADVVHVHDVLYICSWVAAVVARLRRTPYVVHRHVSFVHHSSAIVRAAQWLVLHTVGRMVLRGASAVLAIDAEIARHDAPLVPGVDVEVLGNGVDTTVFRPATAAESRELRTRFGLPVDETLVLFVGRPVPKKGFPLVAEAGSDSYRLVFVGAEGPETKAAARLLFLGSRAPEEVALLYRAADLFVMASVGECPLTILEAMSSGLPVVLADDPALHTPWTSTEGVEFVPRNSRALRAALTSLARDPDRRGRMGRSARAHVVDSFGWEEHVAALERIYGEVMLPG